ncbi:TonB-linked SusC/RagA family outer membrane protein [Sunxiuqinia elliptica]|uniref:TonB-linked SusC/RagA family outer membrane protein n=2 Tax=Sunxiuqinia elliptica TaxID=655355 RepID=A0A4R6GQ60_9BACT|nr:TonB-linked SusC/RagA family outer membrane protein [Sunxiuqinia elliptica]TDO55787.1 TonB-linked SusC/RagA family outer membrane protein [Sunxiuqinia elliptica]
MKKTINSVLWAGNACLARKFLRTMKLTAFLLLLTVFQVMGLESYSQGTTISLNYESTSLKEVLMKIEDETDFYFLYSSAMIDVDQKVSVNVKDERIVDALDQVFNSLGISYEIKGRQVLLHSNNSDTDLGRFLQQSMSVSGKVTDSSGQALPGVAVVIKGTTQGTITDFDGNYNLTQVSAEAILVFSFVGMQTEEVLVGKQSKIDLVMRESTIGLDEVVAIGYGTSTRKKLVSSVSTIKTDEIEDAPYASVVEGLAGRTSGLFVQNSGGEYGSLPQVSIRGRGEPTYVIDGIISSKSEFSMIPPSDIDEISFLKDAAATAVYGFNAANGVVLVVTKTGKKEGITFNYNGDFSFQKPTLLPEYLSPYEIATMKNRAANYDGLPQIIDDETLGILKNNTNPVLYPNLNPFDEAIKQSAMQRRHNISMDGSVNNTSIFMSLDYFGQDGIYKTNDFGLERFSFRSNISHTLEDIGLQINGNMSLQRNLKTTPPVGTWTIWSHVRNWAPGTPLFNPDGNYTGLENPLAEADERAGYYDEEINRINGRLELVWDVPKVNGLTLKAVGNYNFDHSFNKMWRANQRNSAPTYDWDNNLVEVGKPQLNEWTGRTWRYDLEGHINYLRTFADVHTLELTAVYSQSEARYDGFSAYRKDFVSPAVDELFAGSSEGKDNSGNASESGRIGYIGRLKYDYDSKYVLEANFRYDGYDAFPTDQQYKLFPSVSLGWNIDQEAFFSDITNTIQMNAFKVRASWGNLGKLGQNDDEINAFRFSHLAVYNLLNNIYYMDGTWLTGFREGDLTPTGGTTSWYEQESKNLGIDFAFFENKISGTFDWFYDRTTGFLGSPAESYTTPLGKALPRINTNSAFRRGGIEFALNYKMNIGGAVVNLGGNISNYDQLWEKRYDEAEDVLKNPNKRTTHEKDYFSLGYIDEGLYQTIEEIINSPRRLSSTQTMPGDIRYKDVNGDGRIDGDDFIRIGKSGFPHVSYGFNFDINYKGFTLLALFQGTGQKQMSLGSIWMNEINHILYEVQNDGWRPDNTDAKFPRTSSFNSVNGSNNLSSSTFWLKDAWYLRMKSLSLSYDLKKKLLRSVKGVNSVSLLLSATNLFTFSPVTKFYLDPEAANADNYGYPVSKTYNIGVRVSF